MMLRGAMMQVKKWTTGPYCSEESAYDYTPGRCRRHSRISV